jgi:hypothetical protein
VKVTVPLARDIAMLALGSAGMANELFVEAEPNLVRVWVCIGLLLGPAALHSVWRARNPLPPEPEVTSTAVSPPSSPSPSSPPGS